ncbi:MAG: carboxypeptidase regulatory-like domain-containing protein [Thermoplasmatota archaeon]
MRAILMATIMVAVGLAGCAGDEAPVDQTTLVDKEEFQLAAGKGAIAGVVFDDRFRPVVGASILLQPLGLTTESNEVGEFNFVDLDPETYTLRTSAEGHEAKPLKVRVTEGIFEEAQISARRTATGEETIITEHHAAFVACNVSAPIVTANCGIAVPPDVSGDSDRQNLVVDYTKYGENMTYLLIEMHTNKDARTGGAQKIVARGSSTDTYYINDYITEGSYLKMWAKYGEHSPFDAEDRNGNWTNQEGLVIQLWAQGLLKDETGPVFQTALGPVFGTVDNRGFGPQVGLKANYLVTLFLGETSEDIETYCGLCG